jgi:branched-chain amino acid transport system substrate-binding protein
MAMIGPYAAKHGVGSANSFASYAWDAYEMIKAALPKALTKGKPGTEEFRVALRDAIEGSKEVVGAGAVYTMSATDHNGIDGRARVLVRIQDNGFHPIQ